MPIFEVSEGAGSVFHYVKAPDGKYARMHVEKAIEDKGGPEEDSYPLRVRTMSFDEELTMCGEWRPITHRVEEWEYLLQGLKEHHVQHKDREMKGLIYLCCSDF